MPGKSCRIFEARLTCWGQWRLHMRIRAVQPLRECRKRGCQIVLVYLSDLYSYIIFGVAGYINQSLFFRTGQGCVARPAHFVKDFIKLLFVCPAPPGCLVEAGCTAFSILPVAVITREKGRKVKTACQHHLIYYSCRGTADMGYSATIAKHCYNDGYHSDPF